ncbi:MAG: FKBP-type peptidyl-prolyl cis-trans isomerase [Treponema sp.]|jgi:FKBP-type peptidyl-prolyl cis-trans isomerase FkpA|nr:FKBP-type peptidyl-prolyl cis-trans isomerase [Treponema sp.]
MKKTITVLLVLLGIASFSYANGVAEDAVTPDAGPQWSEDMETSYAFGMLIGSDLKPTGMDFNYASFAQGVQDMMEDKETHLTWEEAVAKVQTAYMAAMAKQAEESLAKEAAYLAENGQKPGVFTTESGLQYEILSEGSGRMPILSDTVQVNYEGAFVDGTVFDSSYERGEAEEIPLNMVIPGWSEGIQLMSEGASYRFYIPSELGYGGEGAGQVIPPYATLIFKVELISILDGSSFDEESEEDYPAEDE